jgi:hypothetical protein
MKKRDEELEWIKRKTRRNVQDIKRKGGEK